MEILIYPVIFVMTGLGCVAFACAWKIFTS